MAYTAIDDPEAYFQVVTFSANNTAIGSGGLSVTLPGDTAMQPDLVWGKARNAAEGHALADSVRGTTKNLLANTSAAEETLSEGLTAFNSDGFTVGNNGHWNASGSNMVAWCWKESATAGFDITTWTGNATNRTISHNLSVAPRMLIIKNTSTTDNWFVYHEGMGNNNYMHLETTNAGLSPSTNQFKATTPTSSVFSIGTADGVNKNTSTIICYTFAPVQGFSKFGSYTGNGSTNGTYVHLGFRPAFVLTKKTSGTAGWYLWDNKRSPYNQIEKELYVATDVETSGATLGLDFLSNGFKWRASMSSRNESGGTYVFMAFAEAPFVNSKGVPCNAR